MKRAVTVRVGKKRPAPDQDYASNNVEVSVELGRNGEGEDTTAREMIRKLMTIADQEVDRKLEELGSTP